MENGRKYPRISPGGDSHIKGKGMLVGDFEFNTKGEIIAVSPCQPFGLCGEGMV